MATENWVETVITNWGPMLLLVVVWVYFMRRYNPFPHVAGAHHPLQGTHGPG